MHICIYICIYISSKSYLDLGNNIVLMAMTFSCFNKRSILSSLNVLLANILCSNAFSIFLIATNSPSASVAYLSLAATTIPYAPYPTIYIYIHTYISIIKTDQNL